MNPIVAFFLIVFIAAVLDLISVEWYEVAFGFGILVVVAIMVDDEEPSK